MTSELDLEVARAIGLELEKHNDSYYVKYPNSLFSKEECCGSRDPWSPSTNWSQIGPLIEEYRVEFEDCDDYIRAWAKWPGAEPMDRVWADGEDHLIAACRAIVEAMNGKGLSK